MSSGSPNAGVSVSSSTILRIPVSHKCGPISRRRANSGIGDGEHSLECSIVSLTGSSPVAPAIVDNRPAFVIRGDIRSDGSDLPVIRTTVHLSEEWYFQTFMTSSVLSPLLSPFVDKDVVRNGIPGVVNADEE